MSTDFLVIDNYDSFTYNIVQQFQTLGATVEVWRNDAFTIEGLAYRNPDAIVISPGPGTPAESGLTNEVIRQFFDKKPILGVCLGMQAMGEVFGGNVVAAPELMHGKISYVTHTNRGLFANLVNPLGVTRYHSLVVDRETLPDVLEITAETGPADRFPGLIMGLQHKDYPVMGVQFHPESFLSEDGLSLFKNFMAYV